MAGTRFPIVPSNLPPESVKWGQTVEEQINEILAQLAVLKSQGR